MQQCPYCGAEVNALKNHVRLTNGNDHGPSGEYPAGFVDGVDSAQHVDSTDGVDPEQVPDAGDDEQDSADDSAAPAETDVPPDAQPASTDGGSGIVPESDSHTPDATATQQPSASPSDQCLSCGSANYASASAYLDRYRDRLDSTDVATLKAGERICGDCGTVWD